jgi:hypothetical protein
LGAVLAVLVALLPPPALQHATENQADESRLRAANLERIRRELVASQRPRRTVLDFRADPAPALAAAVGADAARRVAAGDLEGPLGNTTCKPIQRSDVDPRAPVFTCLVEQGLHGEYQGRELVSGYRFRGRVELPSGRAAWCKEKPAAAPPRPGGVRGRAAVAGLHRLTVSTRPGSARRPGRRLSLLTRGLVPARRG